MSNTVTWVEPNVDTLITAWTGVELWHATTQGGVYSLLVQTPYVLHQTNYSYLDSAGLTSDWYEIRRYAPGPVYGSYSTAWNVTTGTSSLLQLKSTFWEFLGELYQGTATGGSTTTLIDTGLIGYTSETWPARIVGQQLRITSGSASGDLRMVGKFDPSDGIIWPNRNPSAAIANTDTYELWGTAINGGSPLTALFNAAIRDLKPVTDTQITIVTNQRIYDISTVVQSRRDLLGVYVRLLDAAGVEPYRIRDLSRGLEWEAYDRGGAATESVALELHQPLTLNTATTQLWVRGETTFAPFAAETDTVDADYRDWLAWEAILELARRKQALGNYDKPRWEALRARAIEELASHRQRWLAGREPVMIATWP